MTVPAAPIDEPPWHATVRGILDRYLASPEGQRSLFKACLDAVAEDDRRRLIHGDDRGYPMPADSLALPLVEIEAVGGDPIDGIRSGIELDPDGTPVAYTIAPAEQDPPRGGHTELTIARFVHEDARIRGGQGVMESLAAHFLDRGDEAITRQLCLSDPRVTRLTAAVEQPLEARFRIDEGAPHSPERALADLLPKVAPGGGVVSVEVGHAGDFAAVPARGQPRNDAEKAPAGGGLLRP